MWGVVSRLPARALGLGVLLWDYLLSLGLRALSLCLLGPLRVLRVYAQVGCRAGLTAASSVALTAHVCTVYIVLQGFAWAAQVGGSWVSLHARLLCALLETLRHPPFLPPCEQAARCLVRVAVWAGRGLARVWGVATCVQLCARVLFLGTCLCLHICFATVSSEVRVRVRKPDRLPWPFRVSVPLNLGLRWRLPGWRPGRAPGWDDMGETQQEPQMPRRRRRQPRTGGK